MSHMSVLTKAVAASAAAAAAGTAYFGPGLLDYFRPNLEMFRNSFAGSGGGRSGAPGDALVDLPVPPWTCEHHHAYTTQLVSLDPLLVYIENFVSPPEAAALMDIGNPRLTPSPLTGYGGDSGGDQVRTSWSAPLPVTGDAEFRNPGSKKTTKKKTKNKGDAGESNTAVDGGQHTEEEGSVVDCVLGRGRRFLGTLLAEGQDDMGVPQMVRHTAGQKLDLHRDWFAQPRIRPANAESGRRRFYNRAATLSVVLQANHTVGGEAWFPHVGPIARYEWKGKGKGEGKEEEGQEDNGRVWREHEEGGLAFKAIPGSALFWVNMFPNGTGDDRVLHAELPIGDGVKTAMNIWPRAYFGPDA